MSDLKCDQPGKAAATMKRMGALPGDCEEGSSFSLLSHTRENLTMEQQIERFSNFFIAVSQEFPPLRLEQLSNETQHKLDGIRPEEVPCAQEHQIYEILRNCKKKKSSVPGHMPPRLFYKASAGLAAPAALIMNRIAQTGSWPEQFLTEWGLL